MHKLHYSAFQELFKELGINPYDFLIISGDKVQGWFPDLPDREPVASVDKLAHVIWEESEEG